MTCHGNDPNPSPECERRAAIREKLDAGELDQELGEYIVERNRASKSRRSLAILGDVIEEFLESRLEPAVRCPEEV